MTDLLLLPLPIKKRGKFISLGGIKKTIHKSKQRKLETAKRIRGKEERKKTELFIKDTM